MLLFWEMIYPTMALVKDLMNSKWCIVCVYVCVCVCVCVLWAWLWLESEDRAM